MRCPRLALMILLAAPPLAAQRAASTIHLAVERYRLPNGLSVILAPDPALAMAHVQVWYRVGSRDEPKGQMGFAHLFEHVMFTGSANAPNGTHDRLVRGAGGWSNGFTNHDVTGYFESVPSHHLERVLWVEADRMGFLLPTLDSARFLAQREVVKNERRQIVDGPYGRGNEILLWAMYPPPHPHGWFPGGYMPDLDAASLGDIRAFFRTWYAPSNATLVIAGGFDPAAAKRAVRHWFGGLRGAPAPPRAAVPFSPLRGERRLVFEDPQVRVAQLAIRWPTRGLRDPDTPALALLASVLSQTEHSRLDEMLVEETKVASGVTASHLPFEEVGDFRVEVMGAPGRTLTEVAAVVDTVIARLKREGPTADEMEMARTILLRNWIAGLEGPDGRAQRLIQGAVQAHDPDYYRTYPAALRRTTAAQVRAAAVRWLGADRVLLSTVPSGRSDVAVVRSAPVAVAADGVGYTFGGAR